MKRVSILLFLLSLSSTLVWAQNNPFEYVEEKPPLMKNEFSLGITLHTSGWGGIFRRAKNITVNKKRFYEIEVVGMKNPKEIRSVNPYFDNAKSFYYGKLNTLTVLRFGLGKQHVLFSKAEKGGVEVRLNYSGGFSLGLAKPVYLNILHEVGPGEYLVEVEKYDPGVHRVDSIYGRASFLEGFGEIKPYPGGYGKLGLTFEYGTHTTNIKCIEAGMCIDLYGKEVPVMAYIDNNQQFLNFYIHLVFGRKW
jgi:hypothetical protein